MSAKLWHWNSVDFRHGPYISQELENHQHPPSHSMLILVGAVHVRQGIRNNSFQRVKARASHKRNNRTTEQQNHP